MPTWYQNTNLTNARAIGHWVRFPTRTATGANCSNCSRASAPAQKAEARRRRAQGATLAELARSYHVGKSTISRLSDAD